MRPFWLLAKVASMHAKAIAFAKSSLRVKKNKIAKKVSKTSLQTHYTNSMQKKSVEKHLIFEKWVLFEFWQKWPPCKVSRFCKIFTLGEKMKLEKT